MPMITRHEQSDPEFYKRMDPEYWHPKWRIIYQTLERCPYPPDRLGKLDEKGKDIGHIAFITYGQVGRREYSEKGKVQYLQVSNIQNTGIDVYKKFARIEAGSYNDLKRSRLSKEDLLLINSGVGSIGRCCAAVKKIGKANVSQHIGRIVIRHLDPAFVAVFLLSKYGSAQLQRATKGVSGQVYFEFDQVRSVLIPIFPAQFQKAIRKEYEKMSSWHNRAMARKKELIQKKGLSNKEAEKDLEYRQLIGTAERILKELIAQTERIIEGKQDGIEPIDGRKINREILSQGAIE